MDTSYTLESHTLEIDGLKFQVEYKYDNDYGAPWELHDGHGVVSEWVNRAKRPSERILMKDSGNFVYYDFAQSLAIAIRDGWGTEAEDAVGLTPKQIAVKAVEDDFQYLHSWANEDWYWIGIVVTHEASNKIIERSLWGIESFGYYKEITARELAQEILDEINERAALEEHFYAGM